MSAMDIGRFKVGQSHEERLAVTPESVEAFALATGDRNPIHFDAAFAATTRFGKPIAHGMLLLGLVSKVLGTGFPGPGTIYVSQEARFLRPVHVGATVGIQVTVDEVVLDKRRLVLSVAVLDEGGEACVRGRAQVYLPE